MSIENLNTTGTCWTYTWVEKHEEGYMEYTALVSYKTVMMVKDSSGKIYKFQDSLKGYSITTKKHCGYWGESHWQDYDALPAWEKGPLSMPAHSFISTGYGSFF